MSKFISEDYMEESVKKVRNHRGCRNPHYNMPHSPEAKAAISATQKARYDLLRKAVEKASNQITEERIMEIVRQTCSEFLEKNTKQVMNNTQKINITL